MMLKVRQCQLSTCIIKNSHTGNIAAISDSNKPELGGPPTTKYVPPSLRGDGAARQGESMNHSGRGIERATSSVCH